MTGLDEDVARVPAAKRFKELAGGRRVELGTRRQLNQKSESNAEPAILRRYGQGSICGYIRQSNDLQLLSHQQEFVALTASGIEKLAEIAVLFMVIWPVIRIAIDPGIRRRFAAFPWIQALIVVSLLTYAVGTTALAALAPALLRVAAVSALLILLIERWQARASHGTRRGRPRGSLAFLPLGPWRDPQYYRRQADRHGPVFKFRHFVRPAIGIVGLEQAADFLRSNDENLAVPPAPFSRIVPGGFVRYLGGVRHHDVASVLRSAFSLAVVEACEARFASEAKAAVDTLTLNGAADPTPAIDRMALHQLMQCFFGVGPGAALDRLASLYDVADYRRLARTGRRRASEAIFELVRELRSLISGASATSISGSPSFLSELVRSDPDALASDEVMCNFAYTFHTARLDVNGLLAWLLVTAGKNEWCLDRLAAELRVDRCGALQAGGMADRIVRETLRLHQSEFLLRRVRRPITWNGFRVPAGWMVRICVQESHRNSELFERPDVFDPDRFLQSLSRTRYSPFGMAPRMCPGEHLSRAIGRHLIAELSTCEISLKDSEPLEFSGFHWRPGANLRVTARARA